MELVSGDLGSLAGSRAAAGAIARICSRLDVLIHNAGVWPLRLVHNEDGFEQSFAVNAVARTSGSHSVSGLSSRSGPW